MPPAEQFEILVVGSGKGGRLLARNMAQSGRRTAVVERQWIGGACHTVACLPESNPMELHRVRYFLALAKTLNFTRASEQCRVTRPALTKGLLKLEQELGGQLIYRERQLTRLIDLGCPSHNVRIITASQFNQHEEETLDVRVLFTPY